MDWIGLDRAVQIALPHWLQRGRHVLNAALGMPHHISIRNPNVIPLSHAEAERGLTL